MFSQVPFKEKWVEGLPQGKKMSSEAKCRRGSDFMPIVILVLPKRELIVWQANG